MKVLTVAIFAFFRGSLCIDCDFTSVHSNPPGAHAVVHDVDEECCAGIKAAGEANNAPPKCIAGKEMDMQISQNGGQCTGYACKITMPGPPDQDGNPGTMPADMYGYPEPCCPMLQATMGGGAPPSKRDMMNCAATARPPPTCIAIHETVPEPPSQIMLGVRASMARLRERGTPIGVRPSDTLSIMLVAVVGTLAGFITTYAAFLYHRRAVVSAPLLG